jgi:inner membrane protease ATP23
MSSGAAPAAAGEATCHEACQEALGQALRSARVVKIMQAMDKLGCSTAAQGFLRCKLCAPNAGIVGGFSTDPAQPPHVMLCEDNIERAKVPPAMVEQTVVHELIHAYDSCRAHVDWDNCLQLACTEVRAANLSGDCSWINEVQRGNLGFTGQGGKCIRRRAELSVAAQPHCKDLAKHAVEQVYGACFEDNAPFFGRSDRK